MNRPMAPAPAPSLQEIIRHNQGFLRQKGRLRVYASAEATLVLGDGTHWHQLCQMGFASDGSFHVSWPYLSVDRGIVAEVTFPDQDHGPVQLSLVEAGRFTSQRVKYSHHRSGVAQFSLTGRVRNDVRRQSFPLTGPIGHLFQLQCHAPRAFKPLARLKPRRLYITFLLPDGLPEDFLIRGGWHRKAAIASNIQGAGNVGPVAPYTHRRTGEQGHMTFWSPPLDCPVADHLVGVLGDPVPTPAGMTDPSLILIAGLDPHELIRDQPSPGRIRGGLAAMYPVDNAEELRQRLGTIDLDPPLGG